VVIVTRVDDNGLESAPIETDDFTARNLSSGMTEKLDGASSEERPSHQFELSREELARDYRRLSIH
jgi:hypothetical protein